MANIRIMRGAPATILAFFPDQYGEPRAVTAATVSAKRLDGTEVIASHAATVATENEGVGVSTELTSAQTATLDRLVFTFVGDDSTVDVLVDIVGGYFFSLADVRAQEASLRKDVGKYTDEDILMRARQEIEEECESICNRAFVPRFGRMTLEADAGRPARLNVPDLRRVRSLKVDGVGYSGSYLETGHPLGLDGEQVANFVGDNCSSNGRRQLTVEFEFGMDSLPADLKPHTITRLRNRLNSGQSGVDARMTSYSNAEGTWALFTPGLKGAKTGLPEVDEAYDRYTFRGNELLSIPIR